MENGIYTFNFVAGSVSSLLVLVNFIIEVLCLIQYAPSLRSRLAPILLFLQTGFIVIYAFCAELEHIDKKDETFSDLYPVFQDVNVAVMLGFGFLGTFLVRYGFSSSGFNLLVAVVATQWAVVLNGMQSWSSHRGTFTVGLRSLVVAEICAASALISMGAVLGKTNPVQLLLVALLEVSGFVLNGWLLQVFLKLRHLSSMMMLHIFGSFFGLTLTRTLYRKESQHPHEKEKFDRKTGLFSMLGTLFLWMFWPSFNSELVELDRPGGKMAAVCSTYLALAVSAVTAAAVSVLTSPKGRLHPDHLQRCTLAGGVAIGVSMSVVHLPWVAMAIGFAAAVISTLGFRYLKLHMLLGFECHDTCGVLCTHGLPGLLGWLAHLILQLAESGDMTTAIRFAVFHICTLLITLSLSMTMGILTGLLLKWNFWRPTQNNKCFDDQAFWEFPHLAVRN